MAHLNLLDAPDRSIGEPAAEGDINRSLQLRLPHHLIEDLIKFSDSGKPAQLSFGTNPSLRFGEVSRPLHISPSAFRLELYQEQTNAPEDLKFKSIISHQSVLDEAKEATKGAENALATLQASLAQYNKDKQDNSATFIRTDANNLKKGQAKNAVGLGIGGKNNSNNSLKRPALFQNASRSMPSSPSLLPQPTSSSSSSSRLPSQSSTLQPTSAPNQSLSQNSSKLQAQRFALFHFLALGPASADLISKKTKIPKDDLNTLLDKVAKPSTLESRQWELSDRWFKDLNVWSFNYPTSEDREKAINNAVRAFDRQRISREDKLWQLLLPKEQRGKGIVLSKLTLSTSASSASKSLSSREDPNAAETQSSLAQSTETMAPAKVTEKTTSKAPPKPSDQKPNQSSETHQVDRKRKSSSGNERPTVSTHKSTNLSGNESQNSKSKPRSQATQEGAGATKAKPNSSSSSKIKSAEYIEDSDDLLDEDTIETGDKKRVKTSQGTAKPAAKPAATKAADPAPTASKAHDVTTNKDVSGPKGNNIESNNNNPITKVNGKVSQAGAVRHVASKPSNTLQNAQEKGTITKPDPVSKPRDRDSDHGSRATIQTIKKDGAKTHRHTQSLPSNTSMPKPAQPVNSLKRPPETRYQLTPSKKARPNGASAEATRHRSSSSPLTNVSDLPNTSPPSSYKRSPAVPAESAARGGVSRSASFSDDQSGGRRSSSSHDRPKIKSSPPRPKQSVEKRPVPQADIIGLTKELIKEYNDKFSKHVTLQLSLDQTSTSGSHNDTQYQSNYKELQLLRQTIKFLMRRLGEDDSQFREIPRKFKASSVPGLVEHVEKKIVELGKKLKEAKQHADSKELSKAQRAEIAALRDEMSDMKALRDN